VKTAALALTVGSASLILLPVVPVLPGVGSLLALMLLIRHREPIHGSWLPAAGLAVACAGLLLALWQLAAAALAALSTVLI
jgi:hypothetical protein